MFKESCRSIRKKDLKKQKAGKAVNQKFSNIYILDMCVCVSIDIDIDLYISKSQSNDLIIMKLHIETRITHDSPIGTAGGPVAVSVHKGADRGKPGPFTSSW